MTISAVTRKDTAAAKELLKGVDPNVDEATLKAVAAREFQKNQPKAKRSYMVYRVNAIRGISGKKKVVPNKDEESAIELAKLDEQKDAMKPKVPSTTTTIEFNTLEYAVREDAGCLKVAVLRKGNLQKIHQVKYATVDGTAVAGDDYISAQGVLVFAKNEHKKIIEVNILEDEDVELDEFFYVTLADPAGDSVSLGGANICTVKILDVSHPGRVGFKHKVKRVQESHGDVKLTVLRKEGAMGNFYVSWKTQDGTAVSGEHYELGQGTIMFEAGEMHKDIRIPIIDNKTVDKDDRYFSVRLYDPKNENKTAQLLPDKEEIRVDISDDEKYSKAVNMMKDLWNAQKKRYSLSTGTWKEQFEDACAAPQDPQALDFFLHSIAFPWKMLFAFIPPTDYANGWVTFACSLIAVGLVTMFIGDVAATFGCMIGLSKPIVAITIVALGTSMPDTFASRTATMMAPDADAAIGNVTGSNSVNVFLGLGLPWVIASFHASANPLENGDPRPYQVVSPTLPFAVTMFTPCALITLGVLFARRVMVGGELGGSTSGRWMTFSLYFFLWVFFIFMSCLKDYEKIDFI